MENIDKLNFREIKNLIYKWVRGRYIYFIEEEI